MADLAGLTAAIEAGDRATAVAITTEAVGEQMDPKAILAAMTLAMQTVGSKFACTEIYVPEMLVAARAMKESSVLLPVLVAEGIRPEHTVIIGTVAGDLHDIGKNLVGMMWKGANLAVVDLGVNVPPQRFVAALAEHQPALVGISALLTTTMGGMKDIVDAIRASGSSVPIIVGGAPVTQEYADEIGADGYARDAATAVDVGKARSAWRRDWQASHSKGRPSGFGARRHGPWPCAPGAQRTNAYGRSHLEGSHGGPWLLHRGDGPRPVRRSGLDESTRVQGLPARPPRIAHAHGGLPPTGRLLLALVRLARPRHVRDRARSTALAYGRRTRWQPRAKDGRRLRVLHQGRRAVLLLPRPRRGAGRERPSPSSARTSMPSLTRPSATRSRTGVRLLWGTANLFTHPRYQAGAATNPDPEVFAYAAAQVKHMLEVTQRLGGEQLRALGRPRGLRHAAQHRHRREEPTARALPAPGRRAQAQDRLRGRSS